MYDNTLGVERPADLTIGCHFDKNKDIYGDYFPVRWPWPAIRIFRKVNNRVIPRWEMMSTAFHEMGHSSHFGAAPFTFTFSEEKLRESYANAVEVAFMKKMYPNVNFAQIRPSYGGTYTGIGEALINQGVMNSCGTK